MGRVRCPKNYIVVLQRPGYDALYLNGEKVIDHGDHVTVMDLYDVIGSSKIESIKCYKDASLKGFPQKLKDALDD